MRALLSSTSGGNSRYLFVCVRQTQVNFLWFADTPDPQKLNSDTFDTEDEARNRYTELTNQAFAAGYERATLPDTWRDLLDGGNPVDDSLVIHLSKMDRDDIALLAEQLRPIASCWPELRIRVSQETNIDALFVVFDGTNLVLRRSEGQTFVARETGTIEITSSVPATVVRPHPLLRFLLCTVVGLLAKRQRVRLYDGLHEIERPQRLTRPDPASLGLDDEAFQQLDQILRDCQLFGRSTQLRRAPGPTQQSNHASSLAF